MSGVINSSDSHCLEIVLETRGFDIHDTTIDISQSSASSESFLSISIVNSQLTPMSPSIGFVTKAA